MNGTVRRTMVRTHNDFIQDLTVVYMSGRLTFHTFRLRDVTPLKTEVSSVFSRAIGTIKLEEQLAGVYRRPHDVF